MRSNGKRSVIVIDDDPDIRFTIGEICSYAGYEATFASSGEIGYRIAKDDRPDLAIVDYHMPGWDGVKTVRALSALGYGMAIIVLTVDERQEIAERFMEAGASDFAVKPIKAPDLLARIRVNLRIRDLYAGMAERREGLDLDKGMSPATMRLVADYLATLKEPATAETVAGGTGLAYQTVHRYLQELVQRGLARVEPVYGQLGRPKNHYESIT